MNQTLTALIAHYGLRVVFANVLIEQLGLPVPAIPVLAVAGAGATAGQISWLHVFASALLACMLADGFWYAVGRRYGNRVMKLLCFISLTPDSCVSETQARFERWGIKTLLVAKFIPGLSLIATPLAGATRIRVGKFAAASAAGSLLWITAGVGGGMLLGKQIGYVLRQTQGYGGVLAAAVMAVFLVYLSFKWWERRRFLARLRMARVSVDDLYRLMEQEPQPVVVDVRSHTARGLQPQRIPGALLVPLEAVSSHLSSHLGGLSLDRDIVLYCNCPNEASAASAAKQFIRHGFLRVRPLQGGLDAWIAAGYNVESVDHLHPVRAA